jgi:hypothetical protein
MDAEEDYLESYKNMHLKLKKRFKSKKLQKDLII